MIWSWCDGPIRSIRLDHFHPPFAVSSFGSPVIIWVLPEFERGHNCLSWNCSSKSWWRVKLGKSRCAWEQGVQIVCKTFQAINIYSSLANQKRPAPRLHYSSSDRSYSIRLRKYYTSRRTDSSAGRAFEIPMDHSSLARPSSFEHRHHGRERI